MTGSLDNFFENFSVRHLIGNHNACEKDWRENDVSYLFHKFYFFTGGEGYLKIEDEVFRPRPGDFCFIPSGTVHSHWQNPDDPVTQYWSHFETDLPEGRHFTYNREALFCRPDRETTKRIFSRLVDRREDLFRPLDRKIALMGLMKIYLEQIDPCLVLSYDESSLIHRVNLYISEHMAEDIRLADLAEAVHLHPNYFVSLFRKKTGSTPIEYLNARRLQKAQRLLDEKEDLTIGEVSGLVGFCDYRYFGRLYKKRFGLPPSRLRVRFRGNSG